MPTISTATTRIVMASRPGPLAGDVVALTENGREGPFECLAGTTPVDPSEGLYIASTTPSFYYARIWDGIHGRPEWFGAVAGNPAVDNRTAFDACVALCPTIQFAAADYYISDVWKMNTSARNLCGVPGSGSTIGFGLDTANPMGMSGGTRIILAGPKVMPMLLVTLFWTIVIAGVSRRLFAAHLAPLPTE